MAEKQIFVRKKGTTGVKFLLTPALKPLLDKGDLEVIPEEELISEDTKQNIPANPAQARYLRRKNAPPGAPYFPWTNALAQVPDFEEYFLPKESAETPEEPKAPDAEKVIAASEEPEKKEEEKITVDDVAAMKDLPDTTDPEETPEEINNNKEQMLIAAIKGLNPEKDFTKQTPLSEPKPKVEVLEAIVGFKITANMRDVAWLAYQEGG